MKGNFALSVGNIRVHSSLQNIMVLARFRFDTVSVQLDRHVFYDYGKAPAMHTETAEYVLDQKIYFVCASACIQIKDAMIQTRGTP